MIRPGNPRLFRHPSGSAERLWVWLLRLLAPALWREAQERHQDLFEALERAQLAGAKAAAELRSARAELARFDRELGEVRDILQPGRVKVSYPRYTEDDLKDARHIEGLRRVVISATRMTAKERAGLIEDDRRYELKRREQARSTKMPDASDHG